MTDNMKLWNAVCMTDPDRTKEVNVRGGFTAIDAMYQMQCATEQFGAAGVGWGWNFTDPIYPPNGTVVIKCVLWHGKKENTVEQFGQKKLGNDEDALKKAGTDALTKCLSYLGFNADVFLGMFDDSKYVESVRVKIKAAAWVNTHMLEVEDCKELRDLDNLSTDKSADVSRLKKKYPDLGDKIEDCYKSKRDKFTASPSQAAGNA